MSPGGPPEEPLAGDARDWDGDIEVLRRRRERSLTSLAIAVIIVTAGALAYYISRPIPLDQAAVVRAAQDAVRNAFGTALVYIFGDPPQVSRDGENVSLVRSEGLVLTQAGASAHWWFDCELHRAPDGSWQPAKLTLMPY
jgi:hypothetical protein